MTYIVYVRGFPFIENKTICDIPDPIAQTHKLVNTKYRTTTHMETLKKSFLNVFGSSIVGLTANAIGRHPKPYTDTPKTIGNFSKFAKFGIFCFKASVFNI